MINKSFLWFAVTIAVILTAGCGRNTDLVIEDGVEYKMISFGSAKVESKEGQTIPCYVITFTYEEEVVGDQSPTNEIPLAVKNRGTINVPKDSIKYDETLPKGVVVWDVPRTIEGKKYVGARWRPNRIDPAITGETIREGEPLTKQ